MISIFYYFYIYERNSAYKQQGQKRSEFVGVTYNFRDNMGSGALF